MLQRYSNKGFFRIRKKNQKDENLKWKLNGRMMIFGLLISFLVVFELGK